MILTTLYQQMRRTPRFSLASIGNQPATWALAQPNALDGLVYVASVASDNPRSAALTQLLSAKLGSKFKALTAYEAQGYDAFQIVKLAIEKAGVDDPVLIKAAIEKLAASSRVSVLRISLLVSRRPSISAPTVCVAWC